MMIDYLTREDPRFSSLHEREKARLEQSLGKTTKGLLEGQDILVLRSDLRRMENPLLKLFVDSQYKKFRRRTKSFPYRVSDGAFWISPVGADFSRQGNPQMLGNIAEFLAEPGLGIRQIQFWVFGVGDEGVQRLTGALRGSNSQLQELAVENDRLTPLSAASISELISDPNCTLRRLSLMHNNGNKHKVIWNPTADLGRVSIQYNNDPNEDHGIADEGARYIFDALRLPGMMIEELNLGDCSLTDEAVPDIESLLQTSGINLKILDLWGNRFTEAGVNAINAALVNSSVKIVKLNQQHE